jgi:hypothetical protein
MSPSKKSVAPRRSRGSHAARRHGAEPAREIRRPESRARTHVSVIAALEKIGWRVTELRPSIDDSFELWRVTIERVDLVAKMTVTALDPDAALAELARYTASDAK